MPPYYNNANTISLNILLYIITIYTLSLFFNHQFSLFCFIIVLALSQVRAKVSQVMELTQQSLLEELIITPGTDNNWPSFPNEMLIPDTWSLPLSDDQTPAEFTFPATNQEFLPFFDALTLPEFSSFYDQDDQIPPLLSQADQCATFDNGFDDRMSSFKVNSGDQAERPNTETGNKATDKKPKGLHSKNLMAERRRRKRLNDRLSMLRSIVPKITKMDRTSILGDAIVYMKELLDKIQRLREEGSDDHLNLLANSFKEGQKTDQMLVRKPQKFDVERRKQDTRVEVCSSANPGLLISTLGTLDALGLDIHQCVVSCFNDFSLQASCYEIVEHRSLVSCEDVKLALSRNAGYAGRCL